MHISFVYDHHQAINTIFYNNVSTLPDPTRIQCLLQRRSVNYGRIVTGGCKIIVGRGNTYNDKIKIANG